MGADGGARIVNKEANANALRVRTRLAMRLGSDWSTWIDDSCWRVAVKYLKPLERRPQDTENDCDALAFVGLDVETRVWSSYLPDGASSQGNHRPSCNRRYEGRGWQERMADEFAAELLRTTITKETRWS
jgi:hypothetical protein